MAESGQQVVLVDCDLRRPGVHEFFHLPNHLGLTSVLLGEAAVEEVLLPVQGDDGTDGLLVIPSGPIPPNPSELLSGASAELLFKQLAESADMVILDSSPVLPVTDAVVLAARVDGVLLVAAHLDRQGADAFARAARPRRCPGRRQPTHTNGNGNGNGSGSGNGNGLVTPSAKPGPAHARRKTR